MTVCCVFVQGEYPYTADYVVRLEEMVRRWIDRPFRFVCLTDQPWLFTTIETIPVQAFKGCQAYWTKLEVFNPARQWKGRMLYLDLDTLIVAPLAPIIDYLASFAVADDPPSVRTKKPKHQRDGKEVDAYGKRIVRKFNSSVMVWDGGSKTELYQRWRLADAERLSGDDYIAEQLPQAAAMPYAWFPRISQVGPPPFGPDVKVILSKFPKNHVLAEQFDWFGPLWGAA